MSQPYGEGRATVSTEETGVTADENLVLQSNVTTATERSTQSLSNDRGTQLTGAANDSISAVIRNHEPEAANALPTISLTTMTSNPTTISDHYKDQTSYRIPDFLVELWLGDDNLTAHSGMLPSPRGAVLLVENKDCVELSGNLGKLPPQPTREQVRQAKLAIESTLKLETVQDVFEETRWQLLQQAQCAFRRYPAQKTLSVIGAVGPFLEMNRISRDDLTGHIWDNGLISPEALKEEGLNPLSFFIKKKNPTRCYLLTNNQSDYRPTFKTFWASSVDTLIKELRASQAPSSSDEAGSVA